MEEKEEDRKELSLIERIERLEILLSGLEEIFPELGKEDDV